MFGKIKLSAEQVEQIISESNPVMVRHTIGGYIYGLCNATTNKYNVTEYDYNECWGVNLHTYGGRTPSIQVLFVYGENNTVRVYDISKRQLNSNGDIVNAVDTLMDEAFSQKAYSEMLERNLSKRWFWKKISYFNKIWTGKLTASCYVQKHPLNTRVEYVYDDELFTYKQSGFIDNKWTTTIINTEQTISHLEKTGYKLEQIEALKAA